MIVDIPTSYALIMTLDVPFQYGQGILKYCGECKSCASERGSWQAFQGSIHFCEIYDFGGGLL